LTDFLQIGSIFFSPLIFTPIFRRKEQHSLSPLEGKRECDIITAQDRSKLTASPLPNFNAERIEMITLPQRARVYA